jgi:hypothetical protein
MKPSFRVVLCVALGAVVALGVAWKLWAADKPAAAAAAPAAAPHYTIAETDGAHAIIVDNETNIVYFYAIDKEGKIGDDLKLKGHVDLNDTGKPMLKVVNAK